MKQIAALVFTCLLGASPALAHGGHAHKPDPAHLHRAVAHMEVALQIRPAAHGQRQLAVVITEKQSGRWLSGDVRIKVVAPNGKTLGPEAGSPMAAQALKQGSEYRLILPMSQSGLYRAMVQFRIAGKVHRAPFEIKL